MKEGFDVGLEMSGERRALREMISNMAHGGRIAMLGIPTEPIAIDLNELVFNMLTLKGIYGREMYETWYTMTVMLQSGLDVSPVITHRFAADRVRAGVRDRVRADDAGKVIIDWEANLMLSDDPRRARARARRDPLRRPVQERARDDHAAGRARHVRDGARGDQLLRQQLPRPGRPSAVVAAAHDALDRWGFGMASVRFICGTQEIHKQLEQRLSEFLGTEDTILFGSCFDANGGLFETLLGAEDAVISDALNHASIIDGIRLCKARRLRYANSDMDELGRGCAKPTGARADPDRHRRRLLDGRVPRAA